MVAWAGTRGRSHRRAVGSWPLFALSLLPLVAAAAAGAQVPVLPSGGTVTAGAARIDSPSASTLRVTQSSSKAIIDWSAFSIGDGGTVRFDNGTGATLNRVTGGSVSSIDGLLSASGSVYLLNPNGVIVGKGGVVEVGGSFVAATLALDDAAFLKGDDLELGGTSGAAVINLGRIGALGRDVTLIAARVENRGEIAASNGSVGLAAGTQVLLRDQAIDGGRLMVRVGGAGTSVTNAGTIRAAAAELRANGGNVYALAGDTGGAIRATGVSAHDGRIYLVAEGGTAEVAGVLDARGAGGAPGVIETSAATLAIGDARVDAHGGTWLLDPTDLTIDQPAATSISAALNGGTDVTERTTLGGASGSGGPSPGAGDIIVAAPIGWSSAARLTLDAYHAIAVDAPITISGPGALTLDYNGSGTDGGLRFATGASADFTGLPGGGQMLTVNGTPYALVYTMLDLAALNAGTGSYALAKNLTAPPIAYPVAVVARFAGTLEGLGHEVSGLTIDAGVSPVPVGLFGVLGSGGVLRDIGVAGGSVGGADNVGALVGYSQGMIVNARASAAVSGTDAVGGLVGRNDGSVTGSAASGPVAGRTEVGGLVGFDTGAVTLSTASGAVSGSGDGIGGLVGTSTGTVTGSTAASTATASGRSFVGGLIGYNTGAIGASGSVASSAAGAASGTFYVGGLAGANLAGGTIGAGSGPLASASGSVTGTRDAIGGLVGVNNGTIAGTTASGATSGRSEVGGLVGFNGSAITLSTASGAVGGSEDGVGGLVGTSAGSISGSTATSTASATGRSYVGGLVGYNLGAIGASGSVASSAAGTANGTFYIGGLVGANLAGGTIGAGGGPSTSASGKVTATKDAIGGLAGENYGDIAGATSSGEVSGKTEVGGLVGYNQGSVTLSTASGAVSGGEDGIGGLVGTNAGMVSGSQATSTAAVSGRSYIGGLVGYNTGIIGASGSLGSSAAGAASGTYFVGGLAGANLAGATIGAGAGPVTSASGQVSGAKDIIGGLVGGNYGTVSGSTATGAVAGNYDVGGLIGHNYASVEGSSASGATTGNQAVGGLVGTNDGTIRIVQASGAVSGNSGIAGLVGYNSLNATIDGATATGAVSGDEGIGGLAGYNNGTITDAHANQTGAATIQGRFWVGGLVAANVGLIVNSSASGAVIGQADDIGGLVGSNTFTVMNSTATGAVSGRDNVGGLVGVSYSLVTGSTASGAVTGRTYVGGLIGATYAGTTAYSSASGAVSASDGTAGGLVGRANSTVRNVQATGAVSGGSRIGGLVGYSTQYASISDATASGAVTGSGDEIGGLVGRSEGSITRGNATQTGVATVQGRSFVGGLAGTSAGPVTNSRASASVNGVQTVGGLVGGNYSSIDAGYVGSGVAVRADNTVGGLVGYANAGSVISASYSAASVVATGDIYGRAGGLVGNNDGTIRTGSRAQGSVSGPTYVGGLVGYNSGTISDAEADGAVTGSTNVGGLVGANAGSPTNRLGRSISNSIATGSVTGAADAVTVGGLVGLNQSSIDTSFAIGRLNSPGGGVAGNNTGLGRLTNIYWDTATTGTTVGVLLSGEPGTNSGGTATNVTGIGGTTGLDPTQQSTYQGFDFTNVYQFGQRSDGRPSLRAVDSNPGNP